MKILVIHTGGTISCGTENGVLVPKNDITPMFSGIAKEFKGVRFVHKRLCSVLSETLDGRVLTKILKCAEKAASSSRFGGIIVTHGSDTAVYTSAALSYVLGVSSIPCVTVCADLPLSAPRSSGHASLRAAVALIVDGRAHGAFAVYPKDNGTVGVHRGSRLLQQLPCDSGLSSVGNADHGYVKNGVLVINEDYSEKPDSFRLEFSRLSALCPVAFFGVYPGMIYPRIGKKVKAVVIFAYHSGTLNTASVETKRFASMCKRRRIPVFVSGSGSNDDYETMNAYPSLGFKRLPPFTSPYAMTVKLWLLLSQKRTDAEALVSAPLGGDI